MAFFAVAGVTVPVAQGSASANINEIGDRARSFDGTLRETIRTRYNMYQGKTIPMDRDTATSVLNALNASTQPQNCTGDMLSTSGGTVQLFTRATKIDVVQTASTTAHVITWEGEEAS